MDYALWMLPFNTRTDLNVAATKAHISHEARNGFLRMLQAEHCQRGAREQLKELRTAWVSKNHEQKPWYGRVSLLFSMKFRTDSGEVRVVDCTMIDVFNYAEGRCFVCTLMHSHVQNFKKLHRMIAFDYYLSSVHKCAHYFLFSVHL